MPTERAPGARRGTPSPARSAMPVRGRPWPPANQRLQPRRASPLASQDRLDRGMGVAECLIRGLALGDCSLEVLTEGLEDLGPLRDGWQKGGVLDFAAGHSGETVFPDRF